MVIVQLHLGVDPVACATLSTLAIPSHTVCVPVAGRRFVLHCIPRATFALLLFSTFWHSWLRRGARIALSHSGRLACGHSADTGRCLAPAPLLALCCPRLKFRIPICKVIHVFDNCVHE